MGFFTPDKQNVNQGPWKGQQPYLKAGFKQAWKQFNQAGPKYFPGSTVAPFSRQQQMAFRQGTQRALQGNKTVGLAQRYNNQVLKGKYNEDPYSGQVFDQIQNKVLPSVNSMFSSAGRYGSGAHGDTAATALTREFAPYASQMHQQGLQRMDQASDRSFDFAADDWRNLAALEGIGSKRQQLAQNEINDATKRWDYYQNQPQNKLNQFMSTISGNYGSQSQQYGPSMFSQLLGGGLGIGGLLGGLGWQPFAQ